jgi:hypothetical protein
MPFVRQPQLEPPVETWPLNNLISSLQVAARISKGPARGVMGQFEVALKGHDLPGSPATTGAPRTRFLRHGVETDLRRWGGLSRAVKRPK